MNRTLAVTVMSIAVGLMSATWTGARAQQTQEDHQAHHPSTDGKSTSPLSSGEVRQIDKSAGKITLKHGPLANLDMPPMTMVFRVKDAAMLDQVKAGDKVSFVAEKVNGALTVMRLEAAK